jgi:transposase
MTSLPDLDQMNPEQLRTLAAQLMSKVDTQSRRIHRDETIIEQLTHEVAILKRHKFAKRSEQICPAQGRLLDDLLNTDLEAIEAELKALHPASTQATQACAVASAAPAHCDPSRAGQHLVRLRLSASAHR